MTVPASAGPSAAVLAAYGVDSPATQLAGGQGTSWRAGDLVFKLDRPDFAEWLASALAGPFEGVRVAPPVHAVDGRWGVEGWTAAPLLAGTTGPAGQWAELFAASAALHQRLAGVAEPVWSAARTDPWAVADAVAWGERPAPHATPLLTRLIVARRPLALRRQLVHGDLAGNVLFAPGLPPGVIDLSPYWRPARYADALAVVDGLLWHGADASLVELAGLGSAAGQLLLRALIFRLAVHRILFPDDVDPVDYRRTSETVGVAVVGTGSGPAQE